MVLSFSKHGVNHHGFLLKIWKGLENVFGHDACVTWETHFYTKLGKTWAQYYPSFIWEEIKPKIHTIRLDEKDRWKAGKNIHFVINNRQSNRFQFAPTLPVVRVQKISVEYRVLKHHSYLFTIKAPIVKMDDKVIFDGTQIGTDNETGARMLELAQNDGFDTIADFFAWFTSDFEGKLIHWTDFKY